MRRTTAALLLISTAFVAQESTGQEFWYVPPGLDYGARAGINLGNGAGFGYGVGVGFPRSQGMPAVLAFQGERQSVNAFRYLDEPDEAQMEVPNSVRLTRLQRQVLLQQNMARKHAVEQRREAAREAARVRNARYFKYLEDQRTATTPEAAAD